MIFIKVFQKLSQFSGKVPLEHWVSRIAINTCLNQIESEKIRPELRQADLSEEEQAVVEKLATSPDELAPDRQLASRQLVEHLLELLKPAERLVIDLLYLQGRTVEEIREYLGVDSLYYLSLEGMLSCVRAPRTHCTACFSGQYPMPVDHPVSKFALEKHQLKMFE